MFYLREIIFKGYKIGWIIGMLFPAGYAQAADETGPLHLAAFGDSITRAFNATGPVDRPWQSWATGNNDASVQDRKGQVKSHAVFLREVTGRTVVTHNAAKTGATASDLDRQVESVSGVAIDYATMLIGANDLCGSAYPGDGSPMVEYGSQVESALEKLISRNPNIKILLVGLPDMLRLQRIGHDTACQKRWNTFGICKSLLRAYISQAEIDLFTSTWHAANETLAAIAARHGAHVIYTSRLSEFPFEREHINTLDCFHPNVLGQNLLSKETWESGWWGH